jgi:hypothetical protein
MRITPSRRTPQRFALLLTTVLVLLAKPAPAREPAPEAKPFELGLNLGLGYHTMYMFRGWNLLQRESQCDPYGIVSLSATWAVFDTGLSLGYWSGHQLYGSNLDHNIDAGLGAEQTLMVTYGRELTADLTLKGGFIWYFYPAADPDVAGASVPSYLEPYVGLTYAGVVDLGLLVAYNAGVQEALADRRYLYLAPSVSRGFELSPAASVHLSLTFGAKVFTQGLQVRDNSFDLLLAASAPLKLTDRVSIKPGLNLGWTNMDGHSLGQELLVWFDLALTVDI